ncbi:phage portal protein [Nocardiopsis sp. NPDC101807]|uniref:phage portal protein n=1 Tax=Nocardiopsis sp. NPDC101807 TaxID=3364339 RepID=UPI00382A5363
MPLPDRNIPWPPKETDDARALMDVHGAWYSGDPDELVRVYGGNRGYPDVKIRSSQYRGGLVGAAARFWWGAPPSDSDQPTRLHVPIASDIASVNADLLYAEPPTLSVEGDPTQKRLATIFQDGMHAALLEGGELCSPYGGVYQRVSWSPGVDHPYWEPIIPDCVAPEWAGQRLRAATLWRVVEDRDGHIYRHLERHEPGRIYHGLYMGTEDRLGRPLPLGDHPETEWLSGLVDADSGITTGATGLAIEYFPNMRPNRTMRGSPLGRSDFQGIEQLMDALDEAYSSWMRDLRLAKARLITPDSFLQNLGRGQGQLFDPEREIYKPVSGLLQQQGQGIGDLLQLIQPDIRVVEHAQTTQALAEQVVRGAGFSAQTFGEGPADVAVTATEVQHRERRTYATRDRKVGYQSPPLRRLAFTTLEIDRHVFKSSIRPAPVTVTFPDGVQDAPKATAETVKLLRDARMLSDEVGVRMVHPDWGPKQVAEEVERLAAENPVVDPFVAAGVVSRQRLDGDVPSSPSGGGPLVAS